MWRAHLVGTVLAVTCACSSRAAQPYVLLDLQTFGGTFSIGNDINELGQVVGQSRHASGHIEAFRTQPNAPIDPATDGLGSLGGIPPDTYGEAINDYGAVIGAGWIGLGVFQATYTLPSGVFGPGSAMGTLGGNGSHPGDINNQGQLVGTARVSGLFPSRGFRTSGLRPINPLTDDLGTLGGVWSDARGINESGQVVGGSTLPGETVQHAFRTAPNARINPATDDIGGLGGSWSLALAINDIAQVVGVGTLPSGNEHAFRTAPGAQINPLTDDLGTLGGANSIARDINEVGTVIGTSDVAVGSLTHAFVCFPGEPMVDLNSLVVNLPAGAVLTMAEAINNRGQIVGRMDFANGDMHGFFLTPVPEPTAIASVASLVLLSFRSACRRLGAR